MTTSKACKACAGIGVAWLDASSLLVMSPSAIATMLTIMTVFIVP